VSDEAFLQSRIEALEAALREAGDIYREATSLARARIEALEAALRDAADDWRGRGDRIEALEAALQEAADFLSEEGYLNRAREAYAALAPEQDK